MNQQNIAMFLKEKKADRRRSLSQAWGAIPRLFLVALLCLGGLTACEVALPGQGEPPKLYRLTALRALEKDIPKTLKVLPWQISIDKPVAAAGLDTPRIAVMRKALTTEYFARVNWIDPAPDMIHTLLVESLESANRLKAVGRDAVGLRPDFVLKTELREFQAEMTGGTPLARVRLNVKIVKMPRRDILASKTVEATSNARGNDLDQIIRAYESASHEALKELTLWTLIQLSKEK